VVSDALARVLEFGVEARHASGTPMKPLIKCALLFLSVAAAAAAPQMSADDSPLVYVASYRMPGPRSGVAAAADDNAIYIVGGAEHGARRGLLNTIVRFDLHTHQCTTISRDVFPRSLLGAAIVGGKLYIIGGAGRSAVLHTMQVFDIASGQMSSGPDMLNARQNFGTVVASGRIYVIGGEIAPPNATREVEFFDIAAQRWYKGPRMPYEAAGRAVLAGNLIIFPGGFRGDMRMTDQRGDLAFVQALDLGTEQWGLLPPLPQRMSGSAIAYLDGDVYLLGATLNSALAVAYDPKGVSHSFDLGQQAIHSAFAVAAGGRIYVIGGNITARLVSANIMEFAENPSWTGK
jgi:N-acetylneuraminic acid mutarotase